MKKNKILDGALIGASIAAVAIAVVGIIHKKKTLSDKHKLTLEDQEDCSEQPNDIEESNIEESDNVEEVIDTEETENIQDDKNL